MAVDYQNFVWFWWLSSVETPTLHQIMFFRYCSNKLSVQTMSFVVYLVGKVLQLRAVGNSSDRLCPVKLD